MTWLYMLLQEDPSSCLSASHATQIRCPSYVGTQCLCRQGDVDPSELMEGSTVRMPRRLRTARNDRTAPTLPFIWAEDSWWDDMR